MSMHASLDGRHKKILRTRIKVWGKFMLKSDVFDVTKAEQLIHNALDAKNSVQSSVKMYGDGMRIGENGVLAALHAEFVPYTNITAFISLREAPHILALCNKEGGHALCVTIIQFKDMDALQVVCDIIDRQRGVATRSNPSTLARSEAAAPAAAPAIPAAKTVAVPAPKPPAPPPPAPTVVVTTVEAPVAPVEPATPVTTEVTVQPPALPPPQPEPEPPKEDIVVATSNTLFEKRPFTSEITQPPVTTEIIVHPSTSSTSAAAGYEEDDDNHFRTSIVFGEEVTRAAPADDIQERQKRMEAILQMRTNGHPEPPKPNTDWIEAVILNYDDVDTEGTHAVFDTPDGPPIQLNESTQNLRRRPNQLLVTANAAPTSPSSSNSRLVVTSFSTGRSDSPTEARELYQRAAVTDSEPAYRTSAVIYRDAPSLDSPNERPRVTYVTNPRSGPAASASATQPMQLVRLVPVGAGGSVRPRVLQQQPQYYAIQPVSPRENGVHLVAKRS